MDGKYIEIELDKTTLPEDGQKVEFHVLEEGEWYTGEYFSEDQLFEKNKRKWWNAFSVDMWRPINKD